MTAYYKGKGSNDIMVIDTSNDNKRLPKRLRSTHVPYVYTSKTGRHNFTFGKGYKFRVVRENPEIPNDFTIYSEVAVLSNWEMCGIPPALCSDQENLDWWTVLRYWRMDMFSLVNV